MLPPWVETAKLSIGVCRQLEFMYDAGILNHHTLDPACMDSLAMLNEPDGMYALDELAHTDKSKLRNPSAFFVKICQRLASAMGPPFMPGGGWRGPLGPPYPYMSPPRRRSRSPGLRGLSPPGMRNGRSHGSPGLLRRRGSPVRHARSPHRHGDSPLHRVLDHSDKAGEPSPKRHKGLQSDNAHDARVFQKHDPGSLLHQVEDTIAGSSQMQASVLQSSTQDKTSSRAAANDAKGLAVPGNEQHVVDRGSGTAQANADNAGRAPAVADGRAPTYTYNARPSSHQQHQQQPAASDHLYESPSIDIPAWNGSPVSPAESPVSPAAVAPAAISKHDAGSGSGWHEPDRPTTTDPYTYAGWRSVGYGQYGLTGGSADGFWRETGGQDASRRDGKLYDQHRPGSYSTATAANGLPARGAGAAPSSAKHSNGSSLLPSTHLDVVVGSYVPVSALDLQDRDGTLVAATGSSSEDPAGGLAAAAATACADGAAGPMSCLRLAVTEYVKEVLKPAWKSQKLSREVGALVLCDLQGADFLCLACLM